MAIITVQNISKQYRLGQIGTGSMHHDINRWWHQLLGKPDPYLRIGDTNDRSAKADSNYVWALKDINFEVQPGEVLGIIGRNGAGKSTLLKILSRVTAPSTGRINMQGRVASLLEVGTGFHQDLTGRENVYLNGAILGMTKKEITRKFDEIIDFAGVERYIDTPVKRYSSGMNVRLGFAVAAHLEPEILIVDEVLAVGDAEFQKKCLGKMKDVSTNEGRTVLFVSHQMDAINRLCKKVLVLDKGTIGYEGACEEGIKYYLTGDDALMGQRRWLGKQPGNHLVRLCSVKVTNEQGALAEHFSINAPVIVSFVYEVVGEPFKATHGFNLYNQEGVHILSSHDIATAKQDTIFTAGMYTASVTLPANFLAEGLHQVSVAMMSYNPFVVHFHETEAAAFIVTDPADGHTARGGYGGQFPGAVRPILAWHCSKNNSIQAT